MHQGTLTSDKHSCISFSTTGETIDCCLKKLIKEAFAVRSLIRGKLFKRAALHVISFHKRNPYERLIEHSCLWADTATTALVLLRDFSFNIYLASEGK